MSESQLTIKKDGLSPKVMVVDDDVCIRQAMHAILSFEGINVVTASNGNDCLQLLRDGFRGVIMMDVMMPGKNGWDTIREIQRCGLLQGNIISMLTAMDVPDEQMEGLQEVVIDYLVKPFEANELIATVRKHLHLLEQMHNGN